MVLKKHQNELFTLIQKSGVDASKFSKSSDDEKGTFAIFIRPSKFTFQIRKTTSYWRVFSRPMVAEQANTQTFSSYPFEWDEVKTFFSSWLSIIKEEFDEPDLWQDFKEKIKGFTPTEQAPEHKFTNNEIRQLQAQLRELSAKISHSSLPAAAKQALLITVAEAPEKAERFTKKEWQGWFLGAVVTQVTTLALSPEHVASIYLMLKTAFASLLLH